MPYLVRETLEMDGKTYYAMGYKNKPILADVRIPVGYDEDEGDLALPPCPDCGGTLRFFNVTFGTRPSVCNDCGHEFALTKEGVD